MKYCIYCGASIPAEAVYCANCGEDQRKSKNDSDKQNVEVKSTNHAALTTQQQILVETKVRNEAKSPTIAYLLWFFLGGLGAHRFYLNDDYAILMPVLTFAAGFSWGIGLSTGSAGALGFSLILFFTYFVWWIADAFFIPAAIKKNKAKIRRKLSLAMNPEMYKGYKNKDEQQEDQAKDAEFKEYLLNDDPSKYQKKGLLILGVILLIIILMACFAG